MTEMSAEQHATRARFLALLRRHERAGGHDPITTAEEDALGPFPWQAMLAGAAICVSLVAFMVGAVLA